MNSIYFEVQTSLTPHLAVINDADDAEDKNNKAFMMARPTLTWFLKYGLDDGHHHHHDY